MPFSEYRFPNNYLVPFRYDIYCQGRAQRTTRQGKPIRCRCEDVDSEGPCIDYCKARHERSYEPKYRDGRGER